MTGAVGPGAVLYTRRACPLCFALERLATRSSRRQRVPLIVVDVDGDAGIRARYGARVPVLNLPGGNCLEGRATAPEVEEAFRRAADFLAAHAAPGEASGTAVPRSARGGFRWLRRAFARPSRRPGKGEA